MKNRKLNGIKNFIGNPANIIGIILIVFLGYTVVISVLQIFKSTFLWNEEDIRFAENAAVGKFTLYHWLRVFGSDISKNLFYKPLLNSLVVGVTVSVTAMALGFSLAWFVVRTDIAYKKLIGILVLVPYLLPSWVNSIAWLSIFKNSKIGGSPGVLQALFHINPPDWISYGFIPIVASLSIHDSVFFYLIVGSALSCMNSQLEEAACICGAGKFKTIRKIVFPIVLPAVLSAVILIFTRAISSYGVPAILGLPVKFYTISTMLYSSMRSRLVTEGNVLSIVLIAISMAAVALNQKLIGKKKSYVTVTGKATQSHVIELGKFKKPLNLFVLLILFLVSIVPLFLIITETFLLKDGVYSLSNLTLHYWIGEADYNVNGGEPGVFKNEAFLAALKNSLTIAVTAALIAAVIGLVTGYVTARNRGKVIARAVEQMSFLPYLIPGISLSTIYIVIFAKPNFILPPLYGSLALIILITVVKEMPFTTKLGNSAMLQISPELEEAAKIGGAGFKKIFSRIIMPLNLKNFFSSFLLVFIGAMKELELIIILVTPKTETLTTLTFYYTGRGYTQLTDAVLCLTVVIIIGVYFIAVFFTETDLMKGIGR